MKQVRTYVITGGTEGIGRATAERLIAQNHKVIVVARSKSDSPLDADFVNADLMDEDSINF